MFSSVYSSLYSQEINIGTHTNNPVTFKYWEGAFLGSTIPKQDRNEVDELGTRFPSSLRKLLYVVIRFLDSVSIF